VRHFPLAAVLTLVVVLEATPLAQSNWRRIDTPNFVAIGDVSAFVLHDIVVKFEGFREILGRLHGPRLIGSAVPTVVVVFPTEHEMGPFRPKFNGKPVDVAGLFVPGRDLNYIAMLSDKNPDNLRVVFHEYTHLLARNSGQQLPVWLSEGLAEYYSTFQPLKGGREAVFGDVVGYHIQQLNNSVLIPIAELLRIDNNSSLYNEGNRRSLFYAEAWALVHMILRAEPSRAGQLSAYVDRVSHGGDPVSAWEEAFVGTNMDVELDRYVRQQSFHAVKYAFNDEVAKFNAPATPMTPSDVQVFLADFQAEENDYDAATARLAELIKRDPSNDRATVTAARLNMMQKRPQNIGDRLRTMAPPADWFLAYLAGVTLADQISWTSALPTAADVAAVERLLGVARSSGREFPNAVARAAELEVHADALPSAETEAALDRARQLAPGRDDYAFLYAQILVRRKEFTRARSVLGSLLAAGSPLVRENARRMMDTIVDYEAGRSSPPSSVIEKVMPPTVRPAYRQTKPGEQRLEAVFEKSECVAGKGNTFYFKAGDQVLTATATKFDDVEFITFRDDLTGRITCGPVKEPMRVYLTWKPGQIAGTKIAVAIEFLPKNP
jgi:hypothetical protein